MSYDAIIIGSGAGGGTLARALAEKGKKVLVIERGDFLPREPQNWDAHAVFQEGRYVSPESWVMNGKDAQPQVHYFVGGATKLYGAALFRMPQRDLLRWPLGEGELDPHYRRAEELHHVHADHAAYRALPHDPAIQRVSDVLQARGLHPEHAPAAVIYPRSDLKGSCVRCHLCDGFPCPLHAKADAETCGIRPALATGNAELVTGARVTGLVRNGSEIFAVRYEKDGRVITQGTGGCPVILAAGAVGSAVIWLRSGIPDASGQAGRNLMMHVNQAVLAVGRDKIPPGFHKTLFVPDWRDTMGTVQMAGQPQAAMLRGESRLAELAPGMTLREIAERSVCFWLMTEDRPLERNQVTADGSRVSVRYAPHLDDSEASRRLYIAFQGHLGAMGFHARLRKRMPVTAVAHQCGTLRTGDSRETSCVDPGGRAWDTPNLYVADASVFPRSGPVNPALTVMAWALRLAERIS